MRSLRCFFFVALVCTAVYSEDTTTEAQTTEAATTTFETTTEATTVETTTPIDTNCKDTSKTKCDPKLCTNDIYIPLMEDQCRKTCGWCNGVTPACHDASGSCKQWAANGFCTNAFNSPDQKKKYCPKTCGCCGDAKC